MDYRHTGCHKTAKLNAMQCTAYKEINNFPKNAHPMDDLEEVVQKFQEAEQAFRKHLPNVEPRLIVDLILRQRRENNPTPIYTIEAFVKPGANTEEIRNFIIKNWGQAPAFYDNGQHIVAAHRIDLKTLKTINDYPGVIRVRGTPLMPGHSSLGPVYDIDQL